MRVAKRRRSKKLDLVCKQNVLLDQNPYDMTFTDSLESVKFELKKITQYKTNDAIIRSRTR